jgi:hypothetical protein
MLRVQFAADPEDDRDLPVVDLHALDERPDELPLGSPIGGRQPILHLGGERLEALHHEAELALEEVLPLDMVDNSAGSLERPPGRAGRTPARVSRIPI